MTATGHDQNAPMPAKPKRRPPRWDAMAAIIASFVGFLALLIAGYTAWIQRYTAEIQTKQVQAQVWPYLISGNDDLDQAVTVVNKGTGPAIVRSVQVRIDGKSQPDWKRVMTALGLPPHHFSQTSLNHYVLSPNEELQIIRFPEKEDWQRFSAAVENRMSIDICFCSTLNECSVAGNKNVIGPHTMALQLRVRQVDQCPRLPAAEVFNN